MPAEVNLFGGDDVPFIETTPSDEALLITKQSLLVVAEVIRVTGGNDEALFAQISPALRGETATASPIASAAFAPAAVVAPAVVTPDVVTHADVATAFARQALASVKAAVAVEVADGTISVGDRQQFIHALATEVVNSLRLAGHFAKLEQQGGSVVVRRAEASLIRLLAEAQNYQAPANVGVVAPYVAGSAFSSARTNDAGAETNRVPRPLLTATELLHELRSGSLLSGHEARAPFMLTGRARVASEMMALMHLLDRFHAVQQQMKAAGGAEIVPEEALFGEFAGAVSDETVPGALTTISLPRLPGKAALAELPNILDTLAGEDRVLRDSYQNPLFVSRDQMPLKLGDLVWHAAATGEAHGATVDLIGDSSPLQSYGFDALYSLIGFDGRTLAPPAFLLVRTEVSNDATASSRFGFALYSESWLRAMIERLKDAASPSHNLLGEALEDALASGNFHQALLRGTVDQGGVAAESFTFAPIFHSAAPAYA